MQNLLTKYWLPIFSAVVLAVVAFSAYHNGYESARAKYELRISNGLRAQAEEHARQLSVLRGRELAARQAQADAEAEGTRNVEKIRVETQSTVDGLVSDNLRLRNRLKATDCGHPDDRSATSLGSGRSVETVGLRQDDAIFLVRRSDAADIRAEALKVCYQYYEAARKLVQEVGDNKSDK